jgi:hypothetical protein
MVLLLSSPTFIMYDELCQELQQLEEARHIIEKIEKGEATARWSIVDDLIIHAGRIFVPIASTQCPASSTPPTGPVTRVSRRLYIAWALPSIAQRWRNWSKILSRVVLYANATSQNIGTRRGCCIALRSPTWYGVTLPSISLRDFLTSVASRWSSQWWTASRSTPTPFLWVTHTLLCPSSRPS